MANRTADDARSIHGTNPQNLVEKILRAKIYQQLYWKEHCFALTAELIIDKAVDLQSVGGTFGGQRKATNFMCLVLKMLQIQPDKEIIVEFIKNEDFKYVRILGAFYMRLVGRPLEVYQYLEPLYNDYRKIRLQLPDGSYILTHVDELIDDLLRKDYMFDIALPRVPARHILEKAGQLDPRLSVLDEEFDEAVLEAEVGEAAEAAKEAAAAVARAEGAARAPRDRDDERDERHRDRDRERWREDRKDRSRRDDDRDRDGRSSRRDHDDVDDRRSRKDRSPSRERKDRRDRSRDKRDARRSRSPDRRDRERDRAGRERERDRVGRDREDEGRDRRDREKKDRGGKGGAQELDPEIVAANELRAKLGLKPLK